MGRTVDYAAMGRRIREARTRANIKMATLAEAVGASLGFIGMLERGERAPSLDMLASIANELGASPNALMIDSLTWVVEMTPPSLTDGQRQIITDMIQSWQR